MQSFLNTSKKTEAVHPMLINLCFAFAVFITYTFVTLYFENEATKLTKSQRKLEALRAWGG